MTTMMTNSQFGLEDMEALLWEPSSPMADAMGSVVLHSDLEDHHKGGGPASVDGMAAPVSPFNSSSPSSSASPLTFYSPPHSPPVVQGKSGISSEMLPWLANPGQLRDAEVVSGDRKDDMFGDLEWMAERVDLSDFDLDSLIGSCSPHDESPSDPDDFLASLELDSLPALSSLGSTFPADIPPAAAAVITTEPLSHSDVPFHAASTPDPQAEIEIKSEPSSAASPTACSPDPQAEFEIKSESSSSASPAYTLDLGSEVDVPMSEMNPAAVVPQVQRVVISLSPTRIVLLLAPKDDAGNPGAASTRCDDNNSPPPRSSRNRPYPDPKRKEIPPLSKTKSFPSSCTNERVASKAPKNKKEKKMEQNKTAATRYRQKKRAEQDALLTEHGVLERKNVELKEKAESMAREIEYLKELMEEVRTARLKSGP
uniref:activating transcription factor 4b n=1 Tax=Doryrhamphus excisus TaxID=161450 RepID=UPI0025AE1A07|nr:activating transcription factor 4b [Doryrhamphus excisus]XP_057906316.1 activating transcription factor 4b [Doryrhamphus excisus]XP_057906317.1 activating transcription factor 4b [Doryrhamphus excisus]